MTLPGERHEEEPLQANQHKISSLQGIQLIFVVFFITKGAIRQRLFGTSHPELG